MRHLRCRQAIRWLTAVSLAFAPPVTQASGFALLEQSASRLGTAFAGTAAAADDATTSFFNPAGLVELQGPEAILVASGVGISSRFRDGESRPAFGQPLGGQGGDAGGWSFVPSAYVAAPVDENLAVGFAVNVPFGLQLEYAPGWIGRFQALYSDIETVSFSPSIAWRANDRISLGAGVSYQRLRAELTNVVNYSAVVAQGVQQLVAQGQLPPSAAPGVLAANLGLEGATRVQGDDGAWGFNIGLMFDLTAVTRIGLAYRSGISHDVAGSVRFMPPPVTDPIGAAIVAGASGTVLANGPVSVELELPDSVLLSLRQKLGDRFQLLADVGWLEWSSIPELRVVRDSGSVVSVTPEKWQDVFRYAVGGAYEVSQSLTLRGGVAYDGTAVPDSTRTSRLPDPARTWLAVGARWQPTKSIVLDFGYAHIFSDDVTLDQDAGNVAAYGLVNGKQQSSTDIVSTQFIYRF